MATDTQWTRPAPNAGSEARDDQPDHQIGRSRAFPAAAARRIEGIAAAAATDGAPNTSAGPAADHPGRWLGGAIGAFVSLVAALVAGLLAAGDAGVVIHLEWESIGLLGIPIAFALGRQLFPMARSGGWGGALGAALALGLAAPPLGAIEILATSGMTDASETTTPISGLAALALLPFAIPISFVAVVMTVPVGLAWCLLVRLVPDPWLEAFRAPAWLARIGIRHALLVIAAGVVFLAVIRPDAL